MPLISNKPNVLCSTSMPLDYPVLDLKYTFPENIIHRKPFGGLFKENLCSADSPKE